MSDALLATAPDRHASVHASAGTGKTWLLVTRLVRLLLAGVEPASILAVTFTRKAAAEMLERLNERLATLAGADTDTLDVNLRQMGLSPSPELQLRARRLYEELLFAARPPRATTFHAFCQEILQRFPVEAEVPPGFELLDSEAELIEAAWDALYAEATLAPDSPTARALENLFDSCNGLPNTRSALHSFLAQRVDWWAFTRHAKEPVAYAGAAVQRLFQTDLDNDPLDGYFTATRLAQLHDYAGLLGRHSAKTFHNQARSVQDALQHGDLAQRLQQIAGVLLTTAGEPRKREASNALINSLGATDCERLVTLHQQLCDSLLDLREHQARQANCRLNQAWYRAGQRLLEHYQRLKREQRVLDFADLEWHAYRLLNNSGQAHWVQYKLDARIDHFLIDEFQDTNPTQWRLLLPLLQELAAGGGERARSVFLVGDAKQSIYRFRRADARLLDTASNWLREHLQAQQFSLEASRRSAQAVIDAVNLAFSDGSLPDFPPHSTHRSDLWGQVELLPPLPQEEAAENIRCGLRNPLAEPRPAPAAALHDLEARRIAARIRELIDAQTLIGSAQDARPLRYGDILILLRNRTHAGSYEQALREADIPYLGAARGTLLDSLEVRDLEALLNTLIAPHNDLALAQVLRSPLFAASDTDLIRLAQTPGASWMERLLTIDCAPDSTLARAARYLPRWQQWVGRLPVHDLLDRIYHEGDVLRRFEAAATDALRPRVRANLIRFIELGLEVDSGRYPSLPHFVARLAGLRQRATDAPDDATPDSGVGDRVQFLTVHGSKGLEAPVVFLADCGGEERDRNAWSAQVEWPAERETPAHMILVGRKTERDRITQTLIERQQQAEQREDSNLLYVALTRARQLLFVSAAVTQATAQKGWYGRLRRCWNAERDGDHYLHRTGTPPQPAQTTPDTAVAAPAPDPRLQSPLAIEPVQLRIAPSRSDRTVDPDRPIDNDAADGRQRGIAIHRLLEWLTTPPARTQEQLLRGIARELQRDSTDPELRDWLAEAESVVRDERLADIFTPDQNTRIYTEVPLQYMQGERMVDGIIDRLLIGPDAVHIIDYKSHPVDAGACRALAAQYREQMRLYRTGVEQLWPRRAVRCSLLFTHSRTLIDVVE